MNEAFHRAVTATAFNLSLSKTQVEVLCAYAQGFDTTEHHSIYMTTNALARKGLLDTRPYCSIAPGHIRGAVAQIRYERYVTRAGKLMVELIKEAGLYIEFRRQGSHFIESERNIGVRA